MEKVTGIASGWSNSYNNSTTLKRAKIENEISTNFSASTIIIPPKKQTNQKNVSFHFLAAFLPTSGRMDIPFSEASHPAMYRAIRGKATTVIVTPLPSGVIAAPKTKSIKTAILRFSLQNFGSTIPKDERTIMIMGSWKAIPKATRKVITKDMKLSMVRKVVTPIAKPYL